MFYSLPIFAPPIGTANVSLGGREMSLAEACCTYNAPQNLTGVPALSLPAGTNRAGLPIGIQLIAGLGRDDVVLSVGAVLEH